MLDCHRLIASLSRDTPTLTTTSHKESIPLLQFRGNMGSASSSAAMDRDTQRRLDAAQQRVPRYLFRGWSRISGGDVRLNTTQAITPRGFLENRVPQHITGNTKTELCSMVQSHVGSLHFPTGFSSWSASLTTAMYFCNEDRLYGYISVIDTVKLREQIPIFHLTDVLLLGGFYPFPEEYLAHGVIDVDHHQAVPHRVFRDDLGAGLKFHLR